ncbi:MAG: hypothetical protein JWP27_2080, partial [Flaviaesturariibacter sp.]|nr:hypothetical protein [Flaviaesturariibacter sp.]
AQKTVQGHVADAETGQPVPGASVFLSNTSVGTTANAQGDFTLALPAGRYDLIVSSIGYETHNQTIQSASVADVLAIRLRPRAKELATVVVEPFETNGWERWGRFFLENFIGTSAEAKQCVLRNKEVVKFRNNKSTGEITAIALEPLVIENRALGYTLRYQLEDFSYQFKTRYLYFGGYPLFTEMTGSPARQRRWAKAREAAYYGSMMHFMRSVFTNTIQEEGYEMYRLTKLPNTERARVKLAQAGRFTRRSDGSVMAKTLPADTVAYYEKILAQEDHTDIVGAKLTGDSIAYAVDDATAGMDFTDYLLVIYKNGRTPSEYRLYSPKNVAWMSQLSLPNGRGIEIQPSGSYYMPADLVSFGYWAWSEKIGSMLPFDYVPAEAPLPKGAKR